MTPSVNQKVNSHDEIMDGTHKKSSIHQEDESFSVDLQKIKLRSLLDEHNGSTRHPDVASTINRLSELFNPTQHCSQLPLFLGTFVALTLPNFPGRIKPIAGEEDLAQYTLGRISFNIFQPRKLICTLKGVHNQLITQETEGRMDQKTFSYNFILDLVIHSPEGDLSAIMVNEAYCYENPHKNDRMMVTFTGGRLLPSDEVKNDVFKLKAWFKTFEGAYRKADEERTLIDRCFQFLIKLLLGLSLPNDDSMSSLNYHFNMRRSPTGYFDVLYLDEDIRITRGNNGTIVVQERCKSVPSNVSM